MAAEIHKNMDFDDWQKAWFEMCRERGHVLKTYDDYIDTFVTSGGHCNGPGCIKCGWTECMHCDWEGKNIPVCTDADVGTSQVSVGDQ